MRVVNRTQYRTDDLRAVFSEVLRREEHPVLRRKRLRVEVVQTARRRIINSTHGYAYLNRDLVVIKMPVVKNYVTFTDGVRRQFMRDLAWTFAHELQHTLGKSHADLRGSRYMRIDQYLSWFDWAADMPLRVKETKKTQQDRAARTLERNRRHLASWERRLKTAKKKVAKYRIAVRRSEQYMEKRAASPKTKETL